jgi:aspartyl-tRNA(Asn)/glutamyl-tRNA(Gln) amidotransferase subunit B
MAHGHFRMDVNVSIHQPHEPWGMRVEIKNLNSFFAVEQALNYEIWRQWVHCASGQRVVQETRLFDDKKGVTQTMRSKENAVDYFYFPDPDLLPVFLTSDLQEEARSEMPPLPDESLLRMINHGGLKLEEAQLIVVHPTYVQLFFSCLNHLEHLCPNEMLQRLGKMVCNWIIGEVFAAQKKEMSQGKGFELLESEIEHQKLPDPIKLAEILSYVIFEKISHPAAKKVFLALNIQESVKDIIQRLKVEQIVDFETLHAFAAKVVEDNPIQVEQYQQKDSFGKEKLFEFFVGKVMGLSQGRAHPEKIRQYLYDFLSKI